MQPAQHLTHQSSPAGAPMSASNTGHCRHLCHRDQGVGHSSSALCVLHVHDMGGMAGQAALAVLRHGIMHVLRAASLRGLDRGVLGWVGPRGPSTCMRSRVKPQDSAWHADTSAKPVHKYTREGNILARPVHKYTEKRTEKTSCKTRACVVKPTMCLRSHLRRSRPQLRPAATSPAGRAGAVHAAPAAWGAAASGTVADSVCQHSCAAAPGGAAPPPAAQTGAPCAGGPLPLHAPALRWPWLSQAAAAAGVWLPAAPARRRRGAPGLPHLRRQYGLHHAHYWRRYCTPEAQPRGSPD